MTSCRGIKSSARIVQTGVPQGSKLSPSLFSFYLADMSRPILSSQADLLRGRYIRLGIRSEDTGTRNQDQRLLGKDVRVLEVNSLLISAPKSTVTLFIPETKQAKYHPDIDIAGSQLPLNRSPKILGVHLDTSLTFNVHCTQAATRVSNRNNILKALAGTTWG